MADLLDEKPPRSEQTVARWAGPAIRRTERFARTVAWIFYALALAVGTFALCLELAARPSEYTTSQEIGIALVSAFFVGVLPGMACRRIILRDAKNTSALIRDGLAYPGALARHARNLENMNVLTVVWNEAGKDAAALVNAPELSGPVQGNVTVVVKPNQRSIGVVLGEQGFFVGIRRR